MNLRHRLNLILIVGLILGLVLLGREIFRPADTEHALANIGKVANVADSPVPHTSPAPIQPAPAPDVTPAANVSSASGTFRGRVIDAVTRQPVREFELEFHPRCEPKAGDAAPGARTFRSVDGRFEWQGLPARLWMVTAKARGYQRFELYQLAIPVGGVKEAVIPLQRGHTLHGRVYDETSGAGIAAAYITFREAHVERYGAGFRTRVRATTGKDGSFVLDGVPDGNAPFATDWDGQELDLQLEKRAAQ